MKTFEKRYSVLLPLPLVNEHCIAIICLVGVVRYAVRCCVSPLVVQLLLPYAGVISLFPYPPSRIGDRPLGNVQQTVKLYVCDEADDLTKAEDSGKPTAADSSPSLLSARTCVKYPSLCPLSRSLSAYLAASLCRLLFQTLSPYLRF